MANELSSFRIRIRPRTRKHLIYSVFKKFHAQVVRESMTRNGIIILGQSSVDIEGRIFRSEGEEDIKKAISDKVMTVRAKRKELSKSSAGATPRDDFRGHCCLAGC